MTAKLNLPLEIEKIVLGYKQELDDMDEHKRRMKPILKEIKSVSEYRPNYELSFDRQEFRYVSFMEDDSGHEILIICYFGERDGKYFTAFDIL